MALIESCPLVTQSVAGLSQPDVTARRSFSETTRRNRRRRLVRHEHEAPNAEGSIRDCDGAPPPRRGKKPSLRDPVHAKDPLHGSRDSKRNSLWRTTLFVGTGVAHWRRNEEKHHPCPRWSRTALDSSRASLFLCRLSTRTCFSASKPAKPLCSINALA